MKALATVSVSEPVERILTSFQYLRGELSHGRYVGHPLPTSHQDLLATRDSERAVVARHAQELAPDPTIVGRVAPGLGLGGDGGGAPPRQRRGGAYDEPCPKPHSIQHLHLLLGENTYRVCRNVTLPILGEAAFCKRWHLGFS